MKKNGQKIIFAVVCVVIIVGLFWYTAAKKGNSAENNDDLSLIHILEDLYRPYKPKRRTRATIAKEKGLEPLAGIITLQMLNTSLEEEAEKFVDPEKEVMSAEDAIAGAKDIIAESISDEADYRSRIRDLTVKKGRMISAAKDPEAESVYEMYYEFDEPVAKLAGHRILALNLSLIHI